MRKNKKSTTRLKKAEKVVRISLISLLSLVLVVGGVAALYVNNLLNKVDYDHDDPTQSSISFATDEFGNVIMPEENGGGGTSTSGSGSGSGTSGTTEDLSGELGEPTRTTTQGDPSGELGEPTSTTTQGDPSADSEEPAPTISDEEAKKVAEEAQNAINDNTPIVSSKDVVNILLIGVDSRTAGRVTNSDTMILISINKTKKQITMSSLMRDMYVAIPGVGNTKLNHANAIGGPSLLLQTVRDNFKIQVSEYMMVDFYSMANIVDILGGVTVNVTAEEVPYVNSSVRETNRQLGRPVEQGLLQSSGTVNLTGAQAVGYARIRRVGHADFGRTQRQRTVMTAIFNKVKGSSIGTLNNLANSILPQVKTNIGKNQLLSYMTLIPQAASYPIKQLQIPANGSYQNAMIGGLSYLVPNMPANRSLLHSTIY